jgi:hypothetical protein
MIRVPMADDDVIDLLQARLLRRCVNSFGIAITVPRKSCIEQQRFSRGRNEQRRCSTFNIDPVDFEITHLRRDRKRKKQNEERKGEFHGPYLYKNRNRSKNIDPVQPHLTRFDCLPAIERVGGEFPLYENVKHIRRPWPFIAQETNEDE